MCHITALILPNIKVLEKILPVYMLFHFRNWKIQQMGEENSSVWPDIFKRVRDCDILMPKGLHKSNLVFMINEFLCFNGVGFVLGL